MLGAVATLLGVPQGIVEAVVTPEVRNGVILDAYDISSNYESWMLQLSRVLVCCSTATTPLQHQHCAVEQHTNTLESCSIQLS